MSFILVKFTPEQIGQVRQISTTEGFIEAFNENLTVSKTFIEAYRMTEASHEQIFGRTKFSCYESFSVCRGRHHYKLNLNKV